MRRFELTFVTLVRLNVKMNTIDMVDKDPKNLINDNIVSMFQVIG